MTGLGALAAGIGAAKRAHAQGAQQGAQGGQDADAQPERRRFGFNDVVGRAQRLAANPFDADLAKVGHAAPTARMTMCFIYEVAIARLARAVARSSPPIDA